MLEPLSPTTRTVLRAAAGIGIAVVAGFGTLALYFVGAVTLTDCFIECGGDPNVLGGGLLLAGAVVSSSVTVTAVVWGAIGWQRRTLMRVATTVAGLASMILVLALAGI